MERRSDGSRRIVAFFGLFVLASLFVIAWFVLRPSNARPLAEVESSARVQDTADAPDAVDTPARALAVPVVAQVSTDSTASAPTNAPAGTAAKPDLSSRLWTTVHVEDQFHAPIEGAHVEIDTLRQDDNTGAAWRPREANPEAVSNFFGDARIWYWEWTSIDGRTQQVDLWVKHPELASVRMRGVVLGPSPIVVVLETGNVVIVGATTAEGTQVKEFTIHTDQDSDVPASPWIARADGRQESSQLGSGKHTLWIEHSSFELGRLYSVPVTFELSNGALHELTLGLKPGGAVVGQLDASVPRPIRNGKVRLIFHVSDVDLARYTLAEVDIHEDGTFRFDDAPGGLCEVFALCTGWVTARTAEYEQEELAWREREKKDRLAELGPDHKFVRRAVRAMDSCYRLQRIRIPTAEPVTLRMERTGRVTMHVTDEQGAPLKDATARLAPNIRWLPSTATLVPWREWQVKTDAQGVAVFEDVPPDPILWSGAISEHHQLTTAWRNHEPEFDAVVKAGETTDITIQLEPKSP